MNIVKRNLLYLAGFLLAAATVPSDYNDDDPSYCDLVPNAQELIANLDETSEGIIQIVQDNGNYKITSSNEDVATAIVEGNKVEVAALKAGSTDLSITDWAKMSTNVKVIVDRLDEPVLSNSAITMYPGENKIVNVYTGNRDYRITADRESVVKATVDEEGRMQTESLAPGNATVTVAGRLNRSAEFSVKVVKRFVIDNNEEIAYLTADEPLAIKVLDGNGGYTRMNNGSAAYPRCTIAENGTDVVVEGLRRYRFDETVATKDQEGESISINIVYIDDLYPENPSYRYLIAGSSSYQPISTSAVGSITYSEEFSMSEIVIRGIGAYASGLAVQFTGDSTKGNKDDAVLYKVTGNAVDKKVKYPIGDCRIDKVEDGWYWVSFLESNCTIRSHMITRQQFIDLTHVFFGSTPMLSE